MVTYVRNGHMLGLRHLVNLLATDRAQRGLRRIWVIMKQDTALSPSLRRVVFLLRPCRCRCRKYV